MLGLGKCDESNKRLAFKELTTLGTLVRERHSHGAKCYVEGASGALGKTRQACTGAEFREAEGVPAKGSKIGQRPLGQENTASLPGSYGMARVGHKEMSRKGRAPRLGRSFFSNVFLHT